MVAMMREVAVSGIVRSWVAGQFGRTAKTQFILAPSKAPDGRTA